MNRETCFEKLEQYVLDESRTITYKILSRELKIHVNKAKQFLQEFLETQKSEENTSLWATYFLSGISGKEAGNPHKVLVVSEKNLEKTKKNLSTITSCHIYSVGKGKVDECSLYAVDHPYNRKAQESEIYSAIKHPNIEVKAPVISKPIVQKAETKPSGLQKQGTSFFKNAAAKPNVQKNDKNEHSVVNSVDKISNAAEVVQPEENNLVKKSNTEPKTQKPNTLASMWQKKEDKPKTENSKSDGKSKAKSPQESKKGQKNNILAMFSKQAEKKVESSAKLSSVSELPNKKTEIVTVKEEVDDDANSFNSQKVKEETKKSTTASKKRKPSQKLTKSSSKFKKENESDEDSKLKKKKHRRICTFDDSDSESESEEVRDKAQRDLWLSEDPIESAAPTQPQTPASDDSEEPIPPTPPVVPTTGKRKVWKTVQKTYQDEDGFFVTKQEKELVSEDDEDPLPQKSSKNKEVKPDQFTYRKQASLMSFFKQK